MKTGHTSLQKLNLGSSLAELSAASWQTAERTGALALATRSDLWLEEQIGRRLSDVYKKSAGVR